MGELVSFPGRPTGPRPVSVAPISMHDAVELRMVIHHVAAGGMHLSAAKKAIYERGAPVDAEALIAASAEEIEAALFHLLTLKGASNADLPLRRLLVERDIERSRR